MKLAVVIPVKDAAHLLPDCVAHIQAQTRLPDEILLAVADSSDDTASVAREFGTSASIRVLDNPNGDRGSGINRVLEDADADVDVIALVDAQARLAPDYLASAWQALQDESVAVVGGPMRPEGHTEVGRAMAMALRSPFGVGDSQFHFEGEARDVDSVYLGIYRRSVYERIGGYHPLLLRVEDDDLNARIRGAGMRIRLDPAIRSTYLCRDTLGGIWTQYQGYGYWKAALGVLRPSVLRWRHFVPAAFVVGLGLGVIAPILGWWAPVAVLVGAYLAAACIAAVAAGSRRVGDVARFVAVAATMHLAYGTGSLMAVARAAALRRRIDIRAVPQVTRR